MHTLPIRIAIILTAITMPIAWSMDCNITTEKNGVKAIGDAIAFTSRELQVDADGAPNAYLVNGKGLSYTCDGVVAIENGKRVTPTSDPDNWQYKCRTAWKQAVDSNDYSNVAIFGFLTGDDNKPVVQGPGDPFPGDAFISTTTVTITDAPRHTQRHEIDATKIPYIVLPSKVVKKFGIKPGDIAIVYRPSTEKLAYAIYGDTGNLGEGSVKLHVDLGSNPIVERGGVKRAKRGISDTVATIAFPSRTTNPSLDHEAWLSQIKSMGDKALNDFGGLDDVKACIAQLQHVE